MKLIQFFIFISLFNLWSQTGITSLEEDDFWVKYKVVYNLKHQSSTINPITIENEAMILYLGDKISRFSSAGKAIGDSLMNNRDKSNKSQADFARIMAQIPKTEFNYYIITKFRREK